MVRHRHLLLRCDLPRDPRAKVLIVLVYVPGSAQVRRVQQPVRTRVKIRIRLIFLSAPPPAGSVKPDPVTTNRTTDADAPIVHSLDSGVTCQPTVAQFIAQVVAL